MYNKALAPFVPIVIFARFLQAQNPTNGIYTSPGSPLIVGHRATTPYNSTGSSLPVKIVPRFWHSSDSVAKATQSAAFLRYVAQRTRIPKNILPRTNQDSEFSARFFYRLIINADGSLQPPTLIQKRFALAESAYSPELVSALELAVRQNVGSLRFSPAAAIDTLIIPMSISLF